MDKAKRYLLQAKEYLSHFKKVEKKGGPPKLKVTNKKTVNIAVIGGNFFPPFCWSNGGYSCYHSLESSL